MKTKNCMNNYMRIVIEQKIGAKVNRAEVYTDWDADLGEMHRVWKGILGAAGFSPTGVEDFYEDEE